MRLVPVSLYIVPASMLPRSQTVFRLIWNCLLQQGEGVVLKILFEKYNNVSLIFFFRTPWDYSNINNILSLIQSKKIWLEYHSQIVRWLPGLLKNHSNAYQMLHQQNTYVFGSASKQFQIVNKKCECTFFGYLATLIDFCTNQVH